ncbi:mRNA cap guanine-N(7) methyltransferase [Diutina catenulata]
MDPEPAQNPPAPEAPTEPVQPQTSPAPEEKPNQLDPAFSRREYARPKKPMASVFASTPSAEEGPSWLIKSAAATKYGAYAKYKTKVASVQAPQAYRKYAPDDPSYGQRPASAPQKPRRGLSDSVEVDDPLNSYELIAAPAAYVSPHADHNDYQTFKSNISHRDDRDINSIVRQHYNQRTRVSKMQGSRTKSPIYKLRNFNNSIKYMLLGNWVRKRDPRHPLTFLDLCCGKGGDLNKCEFVQVDQYVGIDISDASVQEAFSRYSKQKARYRPQGAPRDPHRCNFEACFATGDVFSLELPAILEPNFPGIVAQVFPVDTVSIQFSLHYSFESEEKVRMLLTNVSRSLRPGGTFVGTIPSSDFIRDKIVNKDFLPSRDKVRFGNEIYSVTFEKPPPVDGVFRPPFGHRYDYYLQDAVDGVPEYVVPFETLRALCEEYGMILRYKKNFIDMFNAEIPKYFKRLNKNMIEAMQREDGKYGAEGAQKEAVAFYLAFAFEKMG